MANDNVMAWLQKKTIGGLEIKLTFFPETRLQELILDRSFIFIGLVKILKASDKIFKHRFNFCPSEGVKCTFKISSAFDKS